MPKRPDLDDVVNYAKTGRAGGPRSPNGQYGDPPPLLRVPRLRRLSDVAPERVEWLWPGRIPKGKLSLIGGDGGLGKSLLTMDITARATTGRAWPDCDFTRPPMTVLILTAEDDLADTVRPRLEAVQGDVTRVVVLESVRVLDADQLAQPQNSEQVEQVAHVEPVARPDEAFSLAADLPILEEALRQTGAGLVIIDPLTAYLGDTETHTDARVRVVLRPLSELAGKYGCAIIGIMHLNKAVGKASQYRWTGSTAFLNAARAAHIVAMDKDDQEQRRRVFIPQKQNLSLRPPGLAFVTEGYPMVYDGLPLDPARIVWEPGTVDVTADEALAEQDSAVEEAVEFLRDTLGGRQVMAERVKQLARSADVSWASVRRAKRFAGVRHRKLKKEEDPGTPVVWYLAADQLAQDAQLAQLAQRFSGEQVVSSPSFNEGSMATDWIDDDDDPFS